MRIYETNTFKKPLPLAQAPDTNTKPNAYGNHNHSHSVLGAKKSQEIILARFVLPVN